MIVENAIFSEIFYVFCVEKNVDIFHSFYRKVEKKSFNFFLSTFFIKLWKLIRS